jgi:hypothetical protein
MEIKCNAVYSVTSSTISTFPGAALVATVLSMVLIMVPIEGSAAMCGDPTKGTSYFSGYEAAQADFHSGHGEKQTAINSTNQDYIQGYKDGLNDAQYNINVLEHSVC